MKAVVIFSFIILILTLTLHIFRNGAYASSCFECNKNGCAADPCNSRYYYKCDVNKSTRALVKCKRRYFYVSDGNTCSCSTRRKPTDRPSTHPCPLPLRGRTLVPDECDCSTYWICCSQEGIIKKTCSNGKVFDQTKKKCVNPPSTGPLSTCCGGGQPGVATTKIGVKLGDPTTKIVVQPTVATAKIAVKLNIPTTTKPNNNCPCGDNVSNCPADSICNSFYYCINGIVLKISCFPSSLSFETKPFNSRNITCINRSTEQRNSCTIWINSF